MSKQSYQELQVYIGTYTRREASPAEPKLIYQGRGEGIYRYRLDLVSGALEYLGLTAGVINPSFLAFHPRQTHLYTVNQAMGLGDQPGGAVSAFAFDHRTGELSFLNRQPSHGTGPCHLTVDQSGQFVIVANYRSGSVTLLPVLADGSLGQAADVIQHQGASVNSKRQEGPHAHSVTLDPANRFVFVADLGLDKVMIYRLDRARGKLSPNDPPWLELKAGAGPRHFDFHPGGRHAYLINELDSTLAVLAYDETTGALQVLQIVSTLPEDFEGMSHCADVHVHPTGNFVYGSNRGHDSIAIFSIEAETGLLTLVGHEPTGGRTPRNFAIDPTGTYLLAANQDSDNIVIFQIDLKTGRLTPTGHAAVPSPVCIKMI